MLIHAMTDDHIEKHRILIVEDDTDTRELLSLVLSPSFDCKTVSSRDAALIAIKSGFVPACILMDYTMPGLSLEDFLSEAKSWGLEVILMTGHDEDTVSISALPGISSSLQKPFPPGIILRAVERMVGI